MSTAIASVFWAGTFLVLSALAVPWFLWGVAVTWFGLPVWLWWHVGWLVLTTAVFFVFTRTGWGIWSGVEA
jgi:hypothetical protein